MSYKRLPRAFFAGDTHHVAKDLLGKLLIREWRGKKIIVRITEVESYIGLNDSASHAFRGQTKRNAIMWGDAGHAYIYLIYGMYDCLNIVTEKKNFPAAILIRSGQPIENVNKLTTGPGRLTRAMHITCLLNNEDMVTSAKLFIAQDNFIVTPKEISCTPRVGVAYAGQDALLPWRYYLNNSRFVSPHPKPIRNA